MILVTTVVALVGVGNASAAFVPALAGQLAVDIVEPIDQADVSGMVTVRGTSSDVGAGRVSVSIDGGPFRLAEGTDAWTFDWDTTALADGMHQITARARATIGGPAVFDSVEVFVDNAPVGLDVTMHSPADGAIVLDTFTVSGVSNEATVIELAIDGGPYQPVDGTEVWNTLLDSLSSGPHVLTARASDGMGGEAFDTLSVTVGTPPQGARDIVYSSSVDGAPLEAQIFVPTGFDPSAAPVPLLVHLHGGGGTGNLTNAFRTELDARGWIGLAPDGRLWGLHDPDDPEGCSWVHSSAYVDNPDPDVGPGERDIFDAIDWATTNYPIDAERIYLTGFSMGGRGAYIIGLRNPDRFAAIGPLGPASDMLEVFVRRPQNAACKEGMAGGLPGDSPFVDTMYKITSARFLLENAYNVPVYHGHGLNDTVASNTTAEAPFLHGWHLTVDGSWSACHDAPDFCFGHTPTLAELESLHPSGYDWAFLFTPIGHITDPRWLSGTPITPGFFGTEDPQQPGRLLGLFDFFERRTLVRSPDSLVYKSYTSDHRRAYWATIDVATPWQDAPGAIRATRDVTANEVDLELVRTARVELDLDLAGLRLAPEHSLTIRLDELVEPGFDPALAAPGETLISTIVLRGDFSECGLVRVRRDGVPLAGSFVRRGPSGLEIGPLTIDGPEVLELRVAARLSKRAGGEASAELPAPTSPPGG